MSAMLRAIALCALIWLTGLPSAHAQALTEIPALTSPVVDTTATLDAAAVARLEQQALALRQRKGSQLQVLIVASTQPEDIAQYAQRVYDQWKLGRAEVDDGVLLVIAKDDRRARIHTGYGLEGAIPDITAGRVIQEYLVPKLRAGDFAGGIEDASAVLVRLIDGEALPAPMTVQRDPAPIFDLLFVAIAAFMAASMIRALFGRASGLVRAPLTGAASGLVAWGMSSLPWFALLAAVFGVLYGLIRIPKGHYARHGGWGGLGDGGWGGGGRSGGWGGSSGSGSSSRGSSGGGWSGGGGRSGGGGASGSW